MEKLQHGRQRMSETPRSDDAPTQPVFMDRQKAQELTRNQIDRWSALLERLK